MGKRGPKPAARPVYSSRRVAEIDCPPNIGDAGRAIHDWACCELARQGRLTSDCEAALTGLAQAWQLAADAGREIERAGLVIASLHNAMKNPAAALRHSAMLEAGRWLRELGLTPAARSGLTAAEPPAEPNSIDRFLQKYGVHDAN